MREYESYEPMRGYSPHMVYQSIHFEAIENEFQLPKKTSLLQTIKDRMVTRENLNSPPSKPSKK